MSVAIKTENLSKAYYLGEIGTGTISRDLERWIAKVRGKEDPFLKIGETNDRSKKGGSDVVWSLRDINFEIEQGQAVGIIGRNGAGKSTLLKVLSRVTAPTTGSVKIKGRVASLLEVGTGFHPELTGRENIFLNGAILGMRKKEITRKFDEIVDFAGVERYVDTPVKRYSSGMYVRLAFAVAAHLEAEILVVDEVLAVGDAEFQKKCLGKMGEVSKGEGKTVLFVSHNMDAVTALCKQSILLRHGMVAENGPTPAVIKSYLDVTSLGVGEAPYFNQQTVQPFLISEGNYQPFTLHKVAITDHFGECRSTFTSQEEICITADFSTADHFSDFRIAVNVSDSHDRYVYLSQMTDAEFYNNVLEPGTYTVKCTIPAHVLSTFDYVINIEFYHVGRFSVRMRNPVPIQVQYENPKYLNAAWDMALFRPTFNWELKAQ